MTQLEIQPAGRDTATPLNLAKRIRLLERIAAPLEGRRVVDCGCGGGEYVRALRARGARAAGIEIQRSKLGDAALAGSRAPTLAAADIGRMPFRDGAFEVAIVNEVLEHVPDDLASLREVRRIVAPGGVVVVFSPNRLYPFETHGVFLKRSERRVPHYVPAIPYLPLRLGCIWFRYWARNYWPWELRRLLERAGFEPLRSWYVWQTFENISGHQPRIVGRMSSLLRAVAGFLERVPGVRSFGVSQMLLARRPAEEVPG